MKRVLGYLAGIGLGAAAGFLVSKKAGGRVSSGEKPEGAPPPGAGGRGLDGLKARIARAVDEGRKVMKQTEEELSKQVAGPGDEAQ